MSAPSSINWRACRNAVSSEAKRPPSEKESGVTLTTPITSGRISGRRKRPHASSRILDEKKAGQTLPGR